MAALAASNVAGEPCGRGTLSMHAVALARLRAGGLVVVIRTCARVCSPHPPRAFVALGVGEERWWSALAAGVQAGCGWRAGVLANWPLWKKNDTKPFIDEPVVVKSIPRCGVVCVDVDV